MLKEAGKILDIFIEFCRDNLNMLMIAGVALVVLVLIISIVRPSKEDEDYEFDEFAKKETKVVEVKQPQKTACVEVFEEKKQENNSCEEETPVPVTKNTVSLGTIVEELAELTGEGVKKVEIKIPGAEVRITYVNEEEPAAEIPVEEKPLEIKEEMAEPVPAEIIHREDKKEETVVQTKKFGPENMNTTRSGRVFSEEELQKQIRD